MLVSSPLALAFPSISHYLLASLMLSTLREYFPLIRLPSPSFDAITVLIGSCYSDVWKSRGLSCKILAYYTDRGALEKINVLWVVYAVQLIVYHTRYSMNSFHKGILEIS